MTNRTLLIGWDAADWKIIDPLVERGLMPHTRRLIDNGAAGELRTHKPILSPALWNTIATGKRAAAHGIQGYTLSASGGNGVVPVASTSRRCKALWNIATQQGLLAHAVNWYASHPAEPISGVCVSNAYAQVSTRPGGVIPMPAGSVHPARLAEDLAEVRVHPVDIDRDILLPFIPRGREIDQSKDSRVATLSEILASTFSTHAAITAVLEHEPWDFAAVHCDSIGQISNAFMWYHAPQMPGVSDEDFRLYREVVNGAYCLQDILLGKILALAGEDANVVLVSDHGFYTDHLHSVTKGDGTNHQPSGIAIMRGPDIQQGRRLTNCNILDVAPTVLALAGLPVGEDMEGRVWSEAFEGVREVLSIPSWEQMPGRSGMHPRDVPAHDFALDGFGVTGALWKLAEGGASARPC